MAKAVFQVVLKPLDCAGCFKKMEDEFIRLFGVISVKSFPQLGRVRIEFDEIKVSPEQLETIIVTLGYQVESKKLT